MNRARKQGGAGGTGVKNSVLPAIGSKGKGGAKPIKNSIAVRPGSNSGKVQNSIALCGPMKKGKY